MSELWWWSMGLCVHAFMRKGEREKKKGGRVKGRERYK